MELDSDKEMEYRLKAIRQEEESPSQIENYSNDCLGFHLENETKSADGRYFLERVRHLVLEVSQIFQETYADLLQEEMKKRNKSIPQERIVDLMKRNFFSPYLHVYEGKKAEEELNRLGFVGDKIEGGFMLKIELPKQLGYFWNWSEENWKNYEERGNPDEEPPNSRRPRPQTIAWGDIYYTAVRRAFYPIRDSLAEENDLELLRINNDCHHQPGEFYYLYVIKDLDPIKKYNKSQIWYDDDDSFSGDRDIWYPEPEEESGAVPSDDYDEDEGFRLAA